MNEHADHDAIHAAATERIEVRPGEPAGRDDDPAAAAGEPSVRMVHRPGHVIEDGPGGPGPAPYVTVVLPCYNEGAHVLREIERISAALDASELSYELLCIDDASTDDTLDVLRDA
ncbi:MAG TPA: glycosyltransferase, partial [Phycicoccus sp.]|nr:glycosyltransferase [Phycicoccus sp.]